VAFRVLIIGGTGQVGAAVVRALAAEPSCAEVVMVNRRAISLAAGPRVQQVILDTADAQFPAEVTKLVQSMAAQGDPVYGASCVGVGKGSMKLSGEDLKALEIGVVGGFLRFLIREPSTPASFAGPPVGSRRPGRTGTQSAGRGNASDAGGRQDDRSGGRPRSACQRQKARRRRRH